MFLGIAVIIVLGVLVINYFRNLPTGTTFPTGVSTEDQQGGSETYTVQEGQSLWEIAEDVYGDGFQWTKIAQANNITDPNSIEEGQTLTIPALESDELAMETEEETSTPRPEDDQPLAETPTEAMQEEVSEPAEVAEGTTYTVQKGDSLWKIAQEVYGDPYQWVAIAKANDLVNPDLIHAGNVFVLPAIGK